MQTRLRCGLCERPPPPPILALSVAGITSVLGASSPQGERGDAFAALNATSTSHAVHAVSGPYLALPYALRWRRRGVAFSLLTCNTLYFSGSIAPVKFTPLLNKILRNFSAISLQPPLGPSDTWRRGLEES